MRLRFVVLIVVLATAGTITLDRMSPPSAPARSTIGFAPDAGVLTCPYLTEPGGRASIQLANLGSSPASIRILIPLPKSKRVSIPISLGPGSMKGVTVPPGVKGRSGAVIEFAGGTVVASHTLTLPARKGPSGRGAGVSVAPCQGTGEGDVVIAFASTLKADATLALFNPGSADADVSVTLLAGGRTLQPVRLARRLVPSHARRDFRLGDFAFNTADVTALVHANAGRVAAEVLQRFESGTEFIPAQEPARDLVAVAGKSGKPSVVSATAVGADDSGFAARLISDTRQQSAPGFPSSLPPGGGRAAFIPAQGKAAAETAYSFSVEVGSPLVAGTRWLVRDSAGNPEIASLPACAAASRWGAVIGGVGRFRLERIILVNPGSDPVVARVNTLSSLGASQRNVTIPPGRLTVIVVRKAVGPLAFLVDAAGPIVVAVRSTAVGSTGSIATTAMRATDLSPAREKGVVVDPRAGVPAILPTS